MPCAPMVAISPCAPAARWPGRGASRWGCRRGRRRRASGGTGSGRPDGCLRRGARRRPPSPGRSSTDTGSGRRRAVPGSRSQLGTPHQLGQLGDGARHALPDLAARHAVDEHEERRAGHLVVDPGVGGHHDRDAARRPCAHLRRHLAVGALGDDHHPGAVRQVHGPGRLQRRPERAAGRGARGEESQQGEAVAVGHGDGAPSPAGVTPATVGASPSDGLAALGPMETGAGAGAGAAGRPDPSTADAGSPTPTPSSWSERRMSAWLRSRPATRTPSTRTTNVETTTRATTPPPFPFDPVSPQAGCERGIAAGGRGVTTSGILRTCPRRTSSCPSPSRGRCVTP